MGDALTPVSGISANAKVSTICKICAATTTPIPIVYVCIYDNFVKFGFFSGTCGSHPLFLEKHAENICGKKKIKAILQWPY